MNNYLTFAILRLCAPLKNVGKHAGKVHWTELNTHVDIAGRRAGAGREGKRTEDTEKGKPETQTEPVAVPH